ncbi:DUF6884 domain-containing protein [Haloplanus ruber]|uniref:DUF6884 domain-containing protein n=1 Tax=Haloplanus ruber TaxID=869892 RepID=A0ABD6D2C3_9EURY|nr:DUF6884 domain-containing protein [Haloplanus ruber]
MSMLLVQGCSKSKNQPEEAMSALNLYTGYFFKIIKKAMREDAFDDRVDVCILSAEHGIIDPDAEITWYDRRMDADRAAELAPKVREDLRERITGDYDRVIINVGSVYRRAIEGVDSSVDADIHYIEGEGIGVKGHILKRVVRGEVEAVFQTAEAAGGC